jgi:hypothetical protein
MTPDYSQYTFEELLDVREHIDEVSYPERTKEVELWIQRKKPKQDKIIWLKEPDSDIQINKYLRSLWLLLLIPLFWFGGPEVPNKSELKSKAGVFEGITQHSMVKADSEKFSIEVSGESYTGLGKWSQLSNIPIGSLVEISFKDNNVWVIKHENIELVSFEKFSNYSNSIKNRNKVFAIGLFIFILFSVALVIKLIRYNKVLKLDS